MLLIDTYARQYGWSPDVTLSLESVESGIYSSNIKLFADEYGWSPDITVALDSADADTLKYIIFLRRRKAEADLKYS